MSMLSIYMLLMLVLAFAWIMWFVYRPLSSNHLDLQQSNVDLGKQRLLELEQDLNQGLISQDEFTQAKEEVSTTLALELEQSEMQTQAANHQAPSMTTNALVLVALLVISVSTYWYLAPGFTPQLASSQSAKAPLSLSESAQQIEQHLQDNPQDAGAYQMLGLTYFELGEMEKSLKAYASAYQLESDNVQLLVEYASAVVSSNDNQFNSKSAQLIKRALELDPNSPDALYLAGVFATSIQDLDLAKNLWTKALSVLEQNSPDYQILQSMLLELESVNTPILGSAITIGIEISPALAQARANDFVMVYVKAAQGRPMPIAIQKFKLSELGGGVVLTDQDLVMQDKSLTDYEQLVPVVRISSSGSAILQAGDIQVLGDVINPQENPSIILQVE